MARRTKEEAEQTRESLIAVAERLFLEKGVAKTSLVDIAHAAGVTRGAIYWHFEDKDALFQAMHEQVKLPFDLLVEEAIAKDDPVEGLRHVIIKSLLNIVHNERSRNIFKILAFRCDQEAQKCEGVPREQQCRSNVLVKMEKILTKIDKMGKLDKAYTPHDAAYYLHSFMIGSFLDYVRYTDEYDLEKLAPTFVDTLFKGLFVD